MKRRYNLSDTAVIKNKPFFFDTNVILYIFWPTTSQKYIYDYSSIFAKLIKQKSELFIDYTVISEVINRAIRIEYDNYLTDNVLDRNKFTFKEYRNRTEGRSALQDIYHVLKTKIKPCFNMIGKNFTWEDISSFLSVDTMDFSDKAIELLCKENDMVLVTNDSDFDSSDIEILTSNSKLLKS